MCGNGLFYSYRLSLLCGGEVKEMKSLDQMSYYGGNSSYPYGEQGNPVPPVQNGAIPPVQYGAAPPMEGYPAQPYQNPVYPDPRFFNPMYPQPQGPVVNCVGLKKNYGSVCALDNVNLQLAPGRVIGLLGPNGSGKTTLIKILTGLLCASEGQVEICGVPVGVDSKTMVSYLPDKMFFAGWMRGVDLLDMFEDFYPDFRRDRAEAMCAGMQIPMKSKIKHMSKGTQEKLQLIVAMARRARLYLLDEPIAGVDPAAREFILRTIMSNCEPGSTVLISTHLILDVEPILHDAIFIQKGRVVCYDSVENIRAREGKSLDELFREIFRMELPFAPGYPNGGNMGGMWP